MNILLIADQYPPEIRSISYMIQELAEGLVRRGHEVTVVVSYPRHVFLANRHSTTRPQVDGVKVLRVNTLHYRTSSYLIRGIGELLLPFLFFRKLRKSGPQEVDVVIMYSPPLTLTILGRMVKRLYQARFIVNIQDIFPQNAIDLGILRNSLLIGFFERLANKAYFSADQITTHSKQNAEYLINAKNVPRNKVSTVHNWIDLASYKESKGTGIFLQRYGLEGKFIFLLAGILGPSQQLDFLIEVAREVRDISEICFLIVGEGSAKNEAQNLVVHYGLDNVKFQPFVPKEDYPELVKDVDVGVACLNSKNKTPVYPGKIVGFMASGIPVVAFLHRESDGHQMIKEAGCGYTTVSDDHLKAADLVRKMYYERDRLRGLGEKGFQYASAHFSKEVAIDEMEKLLLDSERTQVI